MASGPSALRSDEICTVRLFSSTTTPGQTVASNSSLADNAVTELDERQQQIERAATERDRLARASRRRSAGQTSNP